MKILKTTILGIFAVAANTIYAAAPIHISGQGSAPYTNLFGKPDKAVEDQAKANAINDAINRALENQQENLRQHFKSAGDSLTLQDYFSKKIVTELSTTLVNDDKEEKTLSYRFEGKLDLSSLRDALNSIPQSSLANQPDLSDVQVAVFFTVRRTAAMQSFDADRKTDDASSSSSALNKESEGSVEESDNGVAQSETSIRQEKNQVKTASSGSTTFRLDKAEYELDEMSKELFGDGLKTRFATKGIEGIFDGAMFESSEQFDEVYGEGKSPRSQHWKAVTEDISNEEPGIQYLVVGCVDFSFPTLDPVTGMPTFAGTVTGKVYKMREPGKIPQQVGGLAPQEAKLSAPSEQDAQKRVVTKLSELTADEIISQLNQKGIL
jgi:hypothetical protein